MNLIMLFVIFAKFGILCFGGGYMIIPLLFEEYVSNIHFFTEEEFGNLISISQLTPGAVSVNTATYVGFLQQGYLGAIFATMGLIFPTLVIANVALFAINKFKNSCVVQGIIQGGKWVAVVMLAYATILFMKMSVIQIYENDESFSLDINYLGLFVAVSAFILKLKTKLSMFIILIIAISIGMLYKFIGL